MKKSQSIKSCDIRDMFKKQSQKYIKCPACSNMIQRVKLDFHLDTDCSSSLSHDHDGLHKVSQCVESNINYEKETVKRVKDAEDNGIHDTLSKTSNSIHDKLSKTSPTKKYPEKPSSSKIKDLLPKTSASMGQFQNRSRSWCVSETVRYSKKRLNSSIDDKDKMKKLKRESDSPVNLLKTDLLSGDGLGISNNKAMPIVSDDEKDSNLGSETLSVNEVVNDDALKTYEPYYIVNFRHILAAVLDDNEYKHLFNNEDKAYLELFHSLGDAEQKLYVRLFQRKYKWLRYNKIKYPEITDDPTCALQKLVEISFLESGASGIDLEPALHLLSMSEVKDLGRKFNIGGKNKAEIIQSLLNHGKQHKACFFSVGSNSINSAIIKKVREVMGPCYRLVQEPKHLFTRILMLFSLPTISEDDEEAAGGQQQQLLTLLQINRGQLTFPNYTLNRQCKIFHHRDDLIRYEHAKQLENDLLSAVEAKNFNLAKSFYLTAKGKYVELHELFSGRDCDMPFFLRRYTANHVYVRCISQGVEILQRLKQYTEAVQELQFLLDQTVYCQDRRGGWWDRMALNLDQHLKESDKAVEVVKQALKDTFVRKGHRYSLLLRAERLKKSRAEDQELMYYMQEKAAVNEAPKVIIKGRILPQPIPGRRNIFISSLNDSPEVDVTVLGVEQLAIEHYKCNGYTEGLHGEGATFISLYALLFWDIIYDGNVCDAFISKYQTHPLDLNSDMFYENRKSQIASHLELLRESTTEDLKKMVQTTWSAHHGNASLVNWDLFVDCSHVEGLVSCLDSKILAAICERFCKDFRFTRSGLPDLVVWNPETSFIKMVEVKGPGDRLSTKQILWLDFLLKIGADAEVCHVEAVGSKKLRTQ